MGTHYQKYRHSKLPRMYHLETKLQCEKLIKINGKFGEIGVDYNE